MQLSKIKNIKYENITNILIDYFPNFKKYYYKNGYDDNDLLIKYEVLGVFSDYVKENILDKNYIILNNKYYEMKNILDFFENIYNKDEKINDLIINGFFENFLENNNKKMNNFLGIFDKKSEIKKQIKDLYYSWYNKII